ncbi:CYTH domain-containing protein [Romeria aff. gracilis LEGE 07310]|uniref:CYTH domain-containing protein n=1 Tax=Vasconcelosia minhoensis LEGE 07310 TaxID=915328 RepID=A0A8J7DCR0_9CYAN|nr:CYTH domain-containing protein [Romeria gracilis]MBE9077933.1 CYTH domain-containing protein [Romeria aff. gracilis LEGE 07310]
MPQEVERKFLVQSDGWRGLAEGTVYRQGYLCAEPGRTVRVRVAGDRGYLTIKGPTQGIGRAEYEYLIPLAEAEEMLDTLCLGALIEKTRYCIPVDGLIWEVDEFSGENAGLVVAEVELEDENQAVTCPDWVGEEVSGDVRYYNASLVRCPFGEWEEGGG